jgi:hypothetical protein
MAIMLLINGVLGAGVFFSIIALVTWPIGRDGPPRDRPGLGGPGRTRVTSLHDHSRVVIEHTLQLH